MKKIKEYIADIREESRLQEEARLKAEFKVVERGGWLWLTHNGVAYSKIEKSASAESIAFYLNEARDTAVEFEKL